MTTTANKSINTKINNAQVLNGMRTRKAVTKADFIAEPSQTPEQIKVLSDMREAKAKAKAKADAAAKIAADIQAAQDALPPFVAASAPTHIGAKAEDIAARFHEAVKQMLASTGAEAIGWKRQFVAFFSTIILSAGAGYVIGTLAGYAIAGIAVLGGSLLWAYLTMVIAAVLAFYSGLKIGQYVGNYVLSGQVDKDLASAKSKVGGWFSSAKSMLTPAPKIAIAS